MYISHRYKCILQEGGSIPELETITANLQHIKNVGFDILEYKDLVEISETPWCSIIIIILVKSLLCAHPHTGMRL